MSASFRQAVAYFEQGDLGKAHEFINAALAEEPMNGEAWHLRGVLALNRKLWSKAIAYLGRAAQLRPQDAAVHVNLAAALNAASHFSQAEQILLMALALNPQSPEAYYQLGFCRGELGRLPESAHALAEATRLRPDWLEALEFRAHVLSLAGDHEKAVDCALQALAFNPNRSICHRVVGDAYMRWLRYDEALEHYKKALTLAPEDALIRNNHALLLTRLGQHKESLEEYGKALALAPLPQAREGYAFSLLAAGRFAEGWLHYVARNKAKGATFTARAGAPPATDPSQLAGRSILAWLDQGVGDQIMFAGLIPELMAAANDVTVECDARLVPILERSFPGIAARAAVATLPAPGDERFAYQVFIPDAARWFRGDFAAFPRHQGYLKPDAALREDLRRSYRAQYGDRPLIGISWRTATNAKVSAQKSLALEAWGPLLSGRAATFVNLQYGNLRAEIDMASKKLGAEIVCDSRIDPLKDMDAFAAQVAALDLVITTSNATAHVAGSLNVPVWTLVPKGFGGMWHWFHDREDSPWYPSMRLLRQTERGNWRTVLDHAAAMLTDFIATWRK